MTDTPISALDPAVPPLSDEMVPCVQDGENRRAPAAAFGIPIASTTPPPAITQYQTWIDESAANPTLSVYLSPDWKPLYSFDADGAMTFASPVSLADGDDLASAVVLRGAIDCSSAPDYPTADLGDLYVVSVAGKIGGASGVDVETGDTLLCMLDGTLSGDQAAVGMNWTIGQGNIDGAVTGPAAAVAGRFAQFSDTTGKIIQDGGLSLDTDGTLASDSDTRIPSQKAVKTYIDAVAQGLDVKPSVKAASTAGLTHSAEQTIDGIACVSGDRVLDKNNAAPALNGIWIVSTGAWTRASDMDSWSEVPGAFCFVEQGTVNGNSGWTCTGDQGGTLGTTAIPWTQFSGAGTYTAGAGIMLSGTQFSAVIGSTGGSEAWSLELDAIASLGTNGIITRTAAHTYTPRSLSAPSSGMTITNADGVAGNPGFVLANDLAALESLASTGIAARTGADAWAQRTLSQPAAGLAITNADGVAGNPTFALANDLSALEGLSATGFAARTATDTWAQRTLTQPASGLTISNSGGVAGNPTFALANDLAALEGLASTGIAVRTATDTWTQRAITGTSAEIAVTNGDGVSGAPTLSLPASLTFTGKTVTGGSFASPAAITGLPDPTNAQDAATKNYVDSLAQGLDVKPSVKAASTASLTHSGTQTIDGVACVAGDRVLDKNNTSAALNGIWVVASGAWTRATDMDSWSEIPGAFCFVEQGTANANSGWTCTSDQGGTLGTTAITWSQFAGPGTFTAGTGLTLTGTQFAAVIGSSGGSEAWSAELDAVAALSTTGLVARTGAHTYAPRSMTAPVAGMTITNPDGVSGSPTFTLANDLAALESLSTTGFAVRTGADAWAQRALTQPAAGLAITNPDGVAGSPTFALANDLAALESLSTTGFAVRTGADSWAQRSLTQPTAGFTVSNADGSAGNPTFALANDLAALEGLSSTGIAVRTGSDAWTQRAITGTSGEIAVTNGDGVSGAPTLGLPASLTFTGKTVTGGTFTSPAINTLADPVNPQDAATKNYIDTSIQGMNVKPSVKAASTSSLTHTGTQTIDGVSCLAGDRVLDKDNSSPALRGIWIVASGSWTRATDMDSWSEIPGAFCFVELGTVNAGTGWFCTAIPIGGTLGSTAMVWSQFAGPGTYTAGSGLTLSGSQFSSVIGSSGGSEAWSAELDAVAALGTTGLVARTAAHTYAPRAITGTSGEIAVTNGDGVSGAPTLGLPASLTFTGKTVTGGTFASPAAITGLPDPTNAQDAATKNYVDATAQGLDVKPSVKAATTASITHSGQQTIDGVFCIAGDRVLDKNNSTPALNGIWIVAAGAWTRAADMNSWNEVPGAFCFVEQGTTNADTGWVCTADQGGTLGTTAVTWSQFAGVGTYSAGPGLTLSGTQFSAVIGSSGGSEAWSAELDAVAALGTTGLVARTAAHTYVPRALQGPSTGNGLTISNGDGIAGNPTIVPSDDLAALEALTGTNTIYYRSGTSTWSPVTVGGMLAFSGGTLNAAPSTDGTMGAGSPSDTVVSSQKAIKTYVDQIISAQDAMVFKGSTDCSGNPNYPAGNRGDTYRVSVAGKIGGGGGVNVEAGDLYICLTDGSVTGGQLLVGANWTVAQANLDGAVIGPASAVSANLAAFNGTTGKLIQDSGLALATDTALGGGSASDALIPSQKAARTYANANIGGLAVSTDTLTQGQAWVWDGQSTTFKACDVTGENLFVNPAFDIWQENTTYSITNSGSKTFGPDGFKAASVNAGRTMSRVAGIAATSYAVKIQRNAGISNNSPVFFAQQFPTEESMYLAGKTVTVSFDFITGANYSPVGGPFVRLYYGTGQNEDIDLHVASPAFATGGGTVASGTLLPQVGASGVVARLIASAIVVPSGVTEVCVAIASSNFPSTAGADDSFTISGVKLEIGSIASHFHKPPIAEELAKCQRRYQKSFGQSTIPAQNAGALSGETRWRRFGAGAVSEVTYVPLKATMRAVPTVTIFNPAAANGQVRNETGGADCTASSTQNVSDAGFEIVCTGNSGGAAGDLLGGHWVADSRL